MASHRSAGPARGSEIDPAQSGTEIAFGTGNVDGVSGNSAMAAGFSPEGELTVLRWPSPSYFDQVSYLTPPLPMQDTGELRDSPRNGAAENAGVFPGLAVREGTGAPIVTWLRDSDWTHEHRYLSPESAVVVTAHANARLGIEVDQLDLVIPNDRSPFAQGGGRRAGVLARHVRLSRDAGSPLSEVSVIQFANLDPCIDKVPYLPLRDVYLDFLNDYALLYSAGRDALVQFRPRNADPGRLAAEPHSTQTEIDALVERLDTIFPGGSDSGADGVFIAMGWDAPSASHQSGMQLDRRPGPSQDAYYDATADGLLSGSSFAQGLASGALQTKPLAFDRDGEAEATFYLAIAGSSREALEKLSGSRSEGFEKQLRRTERWWGDLTASARLPSPDYPDPADNEKMIAVAKRAIINAFIAMDEGTGAIVAAITTQAPYGEDWPRDGAFINYALDLAGLPDLVRRRNLDFYAAVARKPRDLNYRLIGGAFPLDLAGTFEMNYYADGVAGGPILFEIDNTALLVWSFWQHFADTGDLDYLGRMFPAISTATDTLAACRDEESGLQCPAQEDDHFAFTQTLHGATTVYSALACAIASAEALERAGRLDPTLDSRSTWRPRLEELAAAISNSFWLAEPSDGSPPHFSGGGEAWHLWPTEFPMTETERASHAQHLFDSIAPHLMKDTDGSSYNAKTTLSLARIGWRGVASAYPALDLREAQRILMVEVPTAGTDQYGEVFVTLDTDGDGERDRFDNRTAIPHVWEGILNYAASMHLFPPAERPDPGRLRGAGGGCSLAPGPGAPSPGAGPLAAMAAAALVAWGASRSSLSRRPSRAR